jgi:methyl-accepting chemotaxis protein
MLERKCVKLERSLGSVMAGDLGQANDVIIGVRNGAGNGLRLLVARLLAQRGGFSSLVKQIFFVATQLSAFDLKLTAASEKLGSTSRELESRSHSIHTSMEETNSAIAEIASSTNDLSTALSGISAESRTLNENTISSQGKLESMKAGNAHLLEVSHAMRADLDGLVAILDQVGGVVEGIVDISDQTNMLALNASIEAARAGEAGRGFSVVADQVRRLSETTKAQTESIRESLKRLHQASEKSTASAGETVQAVAGINEVIESITEVSSRNSDAIGRIADDLSTISARNEELSAALEEMTATVSTIFQETRGLDELGRQTSMASGSIKETAESMQKIEEAVQKLAHSGGEMAADRILHLSNDDLISAVDAAVTAHSKWMDTLHSIVEQMAVQPLQLDDTRCGFGHFYHSVRPAAAEAEGIWKAVGVNHHALHQKGAVVLQHVKENNKPSAESAYLEAHALSKRIISALQDLKGLAEGFNSRNQSVL